jgi:NADH-quinone oxidoreductase subunit A
MVITLYEQALIPFLRDLKSLFMYLFNLLNRPLQNKQLLEFDYYYSSYNAFFFYVVLIFLICSLILGLCYLISGNNLYYEKTSGYECGSDPFSDAREPFYVKSYLIAILFIIFDVEIVFFFPWIFSLLNISYFGIYIMYIFLVMLAIGFIYEWKKGSLDWD